MRHMSADIPWAVLNMGRADVKSVVDDCELLFRLRISDTFGSIANGSVDMVRYCIYEMSCFHDLFLFNY